VHLSVRLFASAREAVGVPTIGLDLPPGATVGSLVEHLRSSYPLLSTLPELVISVNFEYASSDTELQEGDEVALISMVSGG